MGLDTYQKCIRTALAVTFLFTLVKTRHEDGYCLVKDSDPYLHFSSKTAYEFVHGKDKYQPIPYCKPRQLWMLARHGTRYPSKNEIKNFQSLLYLRDTIIRNHEDRNTGSLCDDDVENLKKWQLNFTEKDAMNLTIQGWNDNKYLALRLKSNFRDLLDVPYSPEKFHIVSSNSIRTELSAKAFVEGMFGADNDIHVPANDSLIKLYRSCLRWENEIDKNPNAFTEVTRFKESPLAKELIYNISSRLGFAYNLSFQDVENMYMLCGYMKAWDYYNVSPWCAAFTRDELKVMEYSRDLWYYYKSGYGHDINLQMGCPVVRDMIDRFTRLANNEGVEPNAVYYFTHMNTVTSVLARLGVAKDPYKLTHDKYFEATGRKWQTSLNGPFLTNLIAVFYKCTEGEENRVLFLLNERVLNYEGCDVGLCSFNYLERKFKKIIDPSTCNKEFCSYNSASIVGSSHRILMFSVVYIVLSKFIM